MTYDQLTDLLYLVRGGRLEAAETIIEKALAINTMPTKIVGPNFEQILNAAGFYRQPEQEPVAWRKKISGVWHYFDDSTPFPFDDCEPLYEKH